MCGVVLWSYSHAYRFGCLCTLGKSTGFQRTSRDTSRQKYGNGSSSEKFVETHSSSPELPIT
jgi:hypothetical protein